MKGRSFILSLLLLLAASMVFTFTAFGADLRASTSPLTTQNTIQLMAVGPEFERIANVKLRAVPTDTLFASFMGLKNNVTDFWCIHMGSAYRAIYGVEEYCFAEMGPQPLRIAWKGPPVRFSMAVKGDSDIKTIADLRGKRVGIYAGGDGYVGACLAFAGLTIQDVKKVPATGYMGAIEMLQRNQVDSAFAGPGDCKEVALSPGGVRFLPIPFSDKEGWKRLQKVYPALLQYKMPADYPLKEAQGVELVGFAFAQHTLATEEPTTGYAIAKVFAEGYDSYKDKHAELKFWTLETCLNCLDVPWPFDEGAIKYFKEKGLWTKAHENWQQEKVRLEKARKDAWPQALKEAQAKGMKTTIDNPQWQELWKSYLDKIQ